MPVSPPICDFGWQAPGFNLPATDGKRYSLKDIGGEWATLVMFICNHCPYVRSVIDRIMRDAVALAEIGVNSIAICSNDAISHPDDSFDAMVTFAKNNHLPFPYLHDEAQDVARAYGTMCTPDFFGFDADLGLQYRGRINESGMRPAAADVRRELHEAMKKVAETGEGPAEQVASMGCSIKWIAA